ncbi:MAG: DUF6452 family protein [Cyclobacteriaceae bacterium]|nr:DUF6452 family protein [Cyclobacteriaceae bacterium]
MKNKQTILFFVLLLLSAACIDESDCSYETQREVKFLFVNASTLQTDTLKVDSVVIVGSDSAYFSNATVSRMSLPVNTVTKETSYFFNLIDGEIDFNIILGYDIMPRVLSEECGVEAEIKQLYVVSHDVDSVIVVSNTFNEEVETNVKVYR